VIVMSDSARERLCNRFDVDPAIIVTIPHGRRSLRAEPRTSPRLGRRS